MSLSNINGEQPSQVSEANYKILIRNIIEDFDIERKYIKINREFK